MSIEQGRKGKGREGREGRINLGPFVSIVEGRRLRMSYRALSPSLGDQEFPMQQLLFLLVVSGVADKKGTCPSSGVCARWV